MNKMNKMGDSGGGG